MPCAPPSSRAKCAAAGIARRAAPTANTCSPPCCEPPISATSTPPRSSPPCSAHHSLSCRPRSYQLLQYTDPLNRHRIPTHQEGCSNLNRCCDELWRTCSVGLVGPPLRPPTNRL